MDERPMTIRLARNPAVLAVVFGVYFALGKLGLAVVGFNGAATAVWPPSGFALAAMVLVSPGIWPAILAAAFLVSLAALGQPAPAAAIAVGNTIEAVVGAVLIERFAGGHTVFDSARTIFRFVAISALCSTPLSATFAAAGMSLTGAAPWPDAPYLWMTAWLANLTGIMVVAPCVLLWATSKLKPERWIAPLEGTVLFAMLVGLGMVVFGGQFPSDVQNYPLEFLCVPFLLWTSFRFGRRETATAVVVISGVAVWGTLHGFGPFVRDTQNEALVLVQAYTSVMAVTGAVLAAAVSEHKHAQRQLRELATTDPLTGLVNYRRLLEVLRGEIARSQRTRRPFAVLFVDMNGLKRINDKHGHLVGSRALCRLSDTLRRSCRNTDTPARYGGDEFAIVLPETGEEGGRLVLRRVCDRLAADNDKPAVSVTGGVAVYPRDGDSPTLLLRAADQVLYRAKSELAARRAAVKPQTLKTGTLF
jgi:diguanylate cyclase (GGDEF)-like protein